MVSWSEFEEASAQLAEAGRTLLFQYGVGLAFLATVKRDGGPRLHPFCPLIVDGRLFAFLIPSPKRNDLIRDGRYALHTFPADKTDDEFCLSGRAAPVSDPEIRKLCVSHYHHDVANDWELFEFGIESALHAGYRFRGDWPPTYTRWSA
jgi:hypothetical protein